MNVTNQRRLIHATAAVLAAAALGSVVWALGPIDTETVAANPTAMGVAGGAREVDDQTVPDSTDFSLPLQKSLHDPPKPAPKPRVNRPAERKPTPPAPPKPPKLDWTLVGTIIDPQRSVAILEDASGKTDIRSIGETVELAPAGVLVRKIDPDKVTLEIRGSESTLRIKQSFASGSPGAGNKNRRRNR